MNLTVLLEVRLLLCNMQWLSLATFYTSIVTNDTEGDWNSILLIKTLVRQLLGQFLCSCTHLYN